MSQNQDNLQDNLNEQLGQEFEMISLGEKNCSVDDDYDPQALTETLLGGATNEIRQAISNLEKSLKAIFSGDSIDIETLQKTIGAAAKDGVSRELIIQRTTKCFVSSQFHDKSDIHASFEKQLVLCLNAYFPEEDTTTQTSTKPVVAASNSVNFRRTLSRKHDSI